MSPSHPARRGSNKMTLDENERSIHDALCVMRALYQKRFLVPGGGAPEAEAAYQLGKVRVPCSVP
jgi:T-complex protein 1 subunit delta